MPTCAIWVKCAFGIEILIRKFDYRVCAVFFFGRFAKGSCGLSFCVLHDTWPKIEVLACRVSIIFRTKSQTLTPSNPKP